MNEKTDTLIEDLKTALANSEANLKFWIDRSELHERRADALDAWIREKHFEERESKLIWSERTAPPPDVFAMPDADQT